MVFRLILLLIVFQSCSWTLELALWSLMIVWFFFLFFFFLWHMPTCPSLFALCCFVANFFFFLSMRQTIAQNQMQSTMRFCLCLLGLSGMGLFLLTHVLGITFVMYPSPITRKLLFIGVSVGRCKSKEGRACHDWTFVLVDWLRLLWCAWVDMNERKRARFHFPNLTTPPERPHALMHLTPYLALQRPRVQPTKPLNHFFFSIATSWTPNDQKTDYRAICVSREKEQLSNWFRTPIDAKNKKVFKEKEEKHARTW